MRARGIGVRGEEGVRSEIRALGRGELLRPGGPGAADVGALLDAAEPCPILSDEWHLLDDVPGPDAALLDLDLRSDGHQVGGGISVFTWCSSFVNNAFWNEGTREND